MGIKLLSMSLSKLLGSFFIAFVFIGCENNNTISSVSEFSSWMNNEENGLKISRSVNGVKVTLSYLTPE